MFLKVQLEIKYDQRWFLETTIELEAREPKSCCKVSKVWSKDKNVSLQEPIRHPGNNLLKRIDTSLMCKRHATASRCLI